MFCASWRALESEQLPDGFELTQVQHTMSGGIITATATIQATETDQIHATGPDYQTTNTTLKPLVPEGWCLLPRVVTD
ncbi:hypothetical protein ACIRCZ_18510 [Leifsonia sp. NPDC102414]|uniref:hypothetical protein n=1 Tax=Leifsonia sp. NPDC102414 TaxID=3364124 RepID=UPI003812D0D9